MAYQFECSENGCAFLVRSSSDAEVERLVRAHVRTVHDGRIAQVDLEHETERIERV
ncbi:DUF1059 domain-containing protein [Halobiforma nitratireducens]|uniref:DUF1059 domain-containing protein n=1 Tax=Halobiforma nitratireducens JCM 10879 TaxID=1227454 RepID=M0LW89_9EURY|nr:DUF1059 domain-containing protein [Halobiforma nitratireducens]EMA37847.1 hypothetical protein C446_10490 [Halobiforma nitratireducens JCM 10879]